MNKGIIYLIQPCELVGTNRYKIGCSKKPVLERCVFGYKKGSRYLCIMECIEPLKLENILKERFNIKFKLIAGKEYFEGDEKEMIREFIDIITEYNIDIDNNDNKKIELYVRKMLRQTDEYDSDGEIIYDKFDYDANEKFKNNMDIMNRFEHIIKDKFIFMYSFKKQMYALVMPKEYKDLFCLIYKDLHEIKHETTFNFVDPVKGIQISPTWIYYTRKDTVEIIVDLLTGFGDKKILYKNI